MQNKSPVVLNAQELKDIREGAAIWQKIKQELVNEIKEGVTGSYLNNKALELFQKYSVEPAFLNYHGFPGCICISVNDCIIHGLGNDTPLKKTDKITLDIGFKNKSVFIDSAHTLIVDPQSNPEYQEFIDICQKALWDGIKAAKAKADSANYVFVGDIASAIEKSVKESDVNKKISIIDGYVGHTIGKELHQRPTIFNKGVSPGCGGVIEENSVICIEPMILKQPTGAFKKGANGHDIVAAKDGALTCHWEHMVLIKEKGIEVLTATKEEIEKFLG